MLEETVRNRPPTRAAWIESIIAARLAEVLEREVLNQIEEEFGT